MKEGQKERKRRRKQSQPKGVAKGHAKLQHQLGRVSGGGGEAAER